MTNCAIKQLSRQRTTTKCLQILYVCGAIWCASAKLTHYLRWPQRHLCKNYNKKSYFFYIFNSSHRNQIAKRCKFRNYAFAALISLWTFNCFTIGLKYKWTNQMIVRAVYKVCYIVCIKQRRRRAIGTLLENQITGSVFFCRCGSRTNNMLSRGIIQSLQVILRRKFDFSIVFETHTRMWVIVVRVCFEFFVMFLLFMIKWRGPKSVLLFFCSTALVLAIQRNCSD